MLPPHLLSIYMFTGLWCILAVCENPEFSLTYRNPQGGTYMSGRALMNRDSSELWPQFPCCLALWPWFLLPCSAFVSKAVRHPGWGLAFLGPLTLWFSCNTMNHDSISLVTSRTANCRTVSYHRSLPAHLCTLHSAGSCHEYLENEWTVCSSPKLHSHAETISWPVQA